MKIFISFLIPFISFLTGSHQSTAMPIILTEKKADYYTTDEQKLQTLVRQVYKWLETNNLKGDFGPDENIKGDKYKGLDLKIHAKNLEELKKTNLFSKEFLDNYNKIALKIDEQLKSKKIEWLKGDIPPFGNDANPWCNCQDNPDHFWKTLTLKNVKIQNNTASFSWKWSWKEGSLYKVKAVKENGVWKISYLEGFNFDEYTKIY